MKSIIIIPLLFITSITFSQTRELFNNEVIRFQLPVKNDTIEFLVADTVLKSKKPVLLFLQGSMPLPMYFELNGKKELFGGGIANFNLDSIRKQYHLVVISMPNTPFCVAENHLNRDYCYVPDTANASVFLKAFYQADVLENYVSRANKVIAFLRKQTWVDKRKLVVAGHSQGTHVAVVLASKNKNITQLGLFSYDSYGRVEKIIRGIRKDAETNKISWGKADSLINDRYEFNKAIHDPEFLKEHPEYLNWNSFAQSTIEILLKLEIPIYVAYGTNDNSAALSDYLPVYFDRAKKGNLTLKRYVNREHNFYGIDEKGRVNYKDKYWVEVVNAFTNWTLTK